MTTQPTGPRVLIVDDEHLIADTLTLIFKSRGFEVGTAYSGEMAVEMAAGLQPDVLISDVVMGTGINGIDAAIEICRHCPDCQVILITGQPVTAELVARARDRGHIFEVLNKPVHPETLFRRIQVRA